MSYAPYSTATKRVNEFLTLLADLGIDMKAGLPTDDALAMQQVFDYWQSGAGATLPDPRPLLRDAAGFVDMASRVLNARNHRDFEQLRPHLQKVGATSILQNRRSSITDADANKVVELYLACVAMRFAANIALDHPDHSRGDNPDVMLDYRGKRWALAIKTVHTTNSRTIFENIVKASDQIEASAANHGLVVISLKNPMSDHLDALWPLGSPPKPEAVVMNEIKHLVDAIIGPVSAMPDEEWNEILGNNRKAVAPVLFMAQATVYALPTGNLQAHPTLIKMLRTARDPQIDPAGAVKLAWELSHHMQGLL